MSSVKKIYVVFSAYGKPMSAWSSKRAAEDRLYADRANWHEGCYLLEVRPVHPKRDAGVRPVKDGGFFCNNTDTGEWVRNHMSKCSQCVAVPTAKQTAKLKKLKKLESIVRAWRKTEPTLAEDTRFMGAVEDWCLANE